MSESEFVMRGVGNARVTENSPCLHELSLLRPSPQTPEGQRNGDLSSRSLSAWQLKAGLYLIKTSRGRDSLDTGSSNAGPNPTRDGISTLSH